MIIEKMLIYSSTIKEKKQKAFKSSKLKKKTNFSKKHMKTQT